MHANPLFIQPLKLQERFEATYIHINNVGPKIFDLIDPLEAAQKGLIFLVGEEKREQAHGACRPRVVRERIPFIMTAAKVAKELSKVLGKDVTKFKIRQTICKKTAVIDIICLFTGLDQNQAAKKLRDFWAIFPGMRAQCATHQFNGQGQRKTLVTDLATLHRILLLLPGRVATRRRRCVIPLVIRYLSLTQMPLDQSMATLSTSSEPAGGLDPPSGEVWSEAPSGQHLYVMEFQGLFKIGRSGNVLRRERQLSGPLGTHHLVEVFQDEGALELHVHRLLSQKRVRGEYFNVTLDEIKAALPQARQEALQTSSSTKTEGDVPEKPFKRPRLAECQTVEERVASLEQSKAKLAVQEVALAKMQTRVAKMQAGLAKRRAALAREEADLAKERSGPA